MAQRCAQLWKASHFKPVMISQKSEPSAWQ